MSRKVTMATVVVVLLIVGFVILWIRYERTAGIFGNSNMEGANSQVVNSIDQSGILKDLNKSNVTIVDVREPVLYAKSHIPNSINIPFADFQKRYQELDKNKFIILVCHTGGMGAAGAQLLMQHGYKRVAYLPRGMAKWSGPVIK